MSNGTALFYPETCFRDLTWLKWALLFWDNGIRRMVLPPEYCSPIAGQEAIIGAGIFDDFVFPGSGSLFFTLPDSTEVSEAVEAGAIINMELTNDECEAATEATRAILAGFGGESEAGQSSFTRLFFERFLMPTERQPIYFDNDWAWYREDYEDLYARDSGTNVIATIVSLDMTMRTALAESKAAELEAPMVTDKIRYAVAAREMLSECSDSRNQADAQTVIQDLVVDFVSPRALDNMSMRAVLDFRRQFAFEMAEFRETIESSLANLTHGASTDRYLDALSNERSKIERAIKKHRAVMRSAGFDFGKAILGASGFGVATTVLNAHGVQLPPFAIDGGVAASMVVAGVAAAMQRRTKVNEFKYEYLLAIRRLSPRPNLIGWFKRKLR